MGTIPLSSADKQRKSHVTSETHSKTLTVIIILFYFLFFPRVQGDSKLGLVINLLSEGILKEGRQADILNISQKLYTLVTPFKIIYLVYCKQVCIFR